MSVKALLRRVRRLEPQPSRIFAKFRVKTVEEFDAKAAALQESAGLCEHDWPEIIMLLKRMAREGC